MSHPDKILPEEAPHDWRAYRPYAFEPPPARYEISEKSDQLTPGVDTTLHEMISVFQGETPAKTYWQLPRMGRVCFAPVPLSSDVVAAKGALGKSLGVESVKRLQNDHWHRLAGESTGWTTIEVNDEVSFMLLHRPSDANDSNSLEDGEQGTQKLVFTMPAGYASFKQLLREYRTLEQLIEPAAIPASRALALLRREVSLPWATSQEAKTFLTTAFTKELGAKAVEASGYNPPDRLDSGLLFRSFKAAVRPQDHYDRAVEGGWDDVRAAMHASPYSSEQVLRSLAEAAGKMMEHGIIHGQLFYDYQNVTSAGEVCDVERAIVTPHVNPELAKKFTAQLAQDEDTFEVTILDNYYANVERMAPDSAAAGRSLLEQAYFLFDTSIRNIDLEQRALKKTSLRSAPGTVLSASQLHELRQCFIATMVDNLRSRGRQVLQAAGRESTNIDTDFRTPEDGPLLRVVLDGHGSTIYGWTDPSRDFDNRGFAPTLNDIGFIVDDFDQFAQSAIARLSLRF